MPAPETVCGIIAGSMAELYIARDAQAATLEWVRINDIDTYTLSTNSTDTSLNTKGWIKSLPMERGLTLTATGRLNTVDEGQRLVDEAALDISCEALRFFRYRVPGAKSDEPDWADWGFWSWPNRGDVGAGTTDPMSWSVELLFWDPPVDLENGQYVAPSETAAPATGQVREPEAVGAGAGASSQPASQSSGRTRQSSGGGAC